MVKKPTTATYQTVLAAPTTELSGEFLQGMADRMAVSFHKYGSVGAADIDFAASIRQRIEKYQETGNTEWLMDVANFAMIEFMVPQHADAHYRPTDSDESPGRTLANGEVTVERNW